MIRSFLVFILIFFVIFPACAIGYIIGFVGESFMSGFKDGAKMFNDWKWEDE